MSSEPGSGVAAASDPLAQILDAIPA